MIHFLPFILGAVAWLAPAPESQPIDKAALARGAAKESKTTVDKVRTVVAWTNDALDWTYTDYKQRTVDDVLARGGGNCNEQAMVVVALLEELGIKTRRVREMNVQPENPGRQERAARRVAENGFGASVFGLRHNDHVWIEYWDAEAEEWVPADPTLNLVGYHDWLIARVGFGERPTHAILASRDMLVPFVIVSSEGTARESRTRRYLVEGFNAVYGGRLSTLGAWAEWTRAIDAIEPPASGALAGTVNMHEHDAKIGAVKAAYENLAREYLAKAK